MENVVRNICFGFMETLDDSWFGTQREMMKSLENIMVWFELEKG